VWYDKQYFSDFCKFRSVCFESLEPKFQLNRNVIGYETNYFSSYAHNNITQILEGAARD
jgi:hypothetical protein